MPKKTDYHTRTDMSNEAKLRDGLKTLPDFARSFFYSIETTRSTRTRISYFYDVRIFLRFLIEMNPTHNGKSIRDLSVKDIASLNSQDIIEYMNYLRVYEGPSDKTGCAETVTNGERGLKRKMSSLRSFFSFLYKHGFITNDPTALVDMPKVHQKNIIRLDAAEVASLLELIENGAKNMTKRERSYFEKTRERDLCIVTLLLGTGIRVSECVGLDVEDIDFRENRLRVVRKGGNEAYVYFGEEVEKALRKYLVERDGIKPEPGHESALFYSLQRKRINIRSVENLVEKYASPVSNGKRITPHKLRSTYGTSLYRETGDIYLVADVLGHKSVETTRKHYAAMDEGKRRLAANAVKLHRDGDDTEITEQ